MDKQRTTTEGPDRMNGARSTERKRKDIKLIDKATEIAIEIYEPALKELEKH